MGISGQGLPRNLQALGQLLPVAIALGQLRDER